MIEHQLTIKEKIISLLYSYGITEIPEIEPEAEGLLLVALQKNIANVYLDQDGGLNIEYDE